MARTGRGWDAKPPDPRRAANRRRGQAQFPDPPDGPVDPLDEADTDPYADRYTGDESSEPAPPTTRRKSLPWSAGSPTTSAEDAGGSDPEGEPPRRGRRESLPWSNASSPVQSGEDPAPSGDGFGRARGKRGAARGGGSGEAGGRWGAKRSGGDTTGGDTPEVRDDYEVAREICLKQLATRPRTRSELATAMKKRGVPPEVASAVLDRYGEVGMIDDAAFARAWVSSRHHSKGLAGRALAQELRQRGVEQEVAQEALSELEPETEAQTALALAMRKLRSARGEPEAVFRRLLGMLARKGYSGGVAVRAVKEAMAARDSELADLIDPDVYEE